MSEKRWKKSEFVKKVEQIYGRGLGCVEADLLLSIIEEIHGPWLPEEPELPGQLGEVSGGPCAVICRGVGARSGDPLILNLSVNHEEKRLLRAMVALYDAWGPEGTLRRKLAGMTDDGEPGAEFIFGQADVDALLAKPWEEK